MIFIKAAKTKIFHLPYVHTNSQYKVNLGGDVLGSGATGTSGGIGATGVAGGAGSSGGTSYSAANIKGEFSLKYESPEEINNFFDRLEESVANILGIPFTGGGAAPVLTGSTAGKKYLTVIR
ncbi:MAG: hypothetical protein Q9M89_09720 [Persephonella sp.]|nr:hypothetical protein [Persephonella sp.]